jgi:hypothetical protein
MAKFTTLNIFLCQVFTPFFIFFTFSLIVFSEEEEAGSNGDLNDGVGGGGPIVRTRYGQIRGRTLALEKGAQKMDLFLGVPYAQPPVGYRRFEVSSICGN